MKKTLFLILIAILFLSNIHLQADAKDFTSNVSAEGAILMDAETGTVLYEKNIDTPYPPASTTKLMTALLTLEKCKLDDIVKVGKNPPRVDGSRIGIAENEETTVKDLVAGMMLMSGNDCAIALAEHMSGSIEEFANLMNKRAKELGCENTNFVNPNGLYDKNHKASAKDMALIMRELIKHDEYKEIALTFSCKTSPTTKHPNGIDLANSNQLMWKNAKYSYKGIEAGKTGYTIDSNHSFVASASRNGQRLIVALLYDKNKTFFEDTVNLFNFGFNNFQLLKLYSKGDVISTYTSQNLNIPLLAEKDFYYVKANDSNDTPTTTFLTDDLNVKSFYHGDKVGAASIFIKDKQLGTINLLSSVDHEIKPLVASAMVLNTFANNSPLKITIYIVVGIILFVATIMIIRKIRKKKRNTIFYK